MSAGPRSRSNPHSPEPPEPPETPKPPASGPVSESAVAEGGTPAFPEAPGVRETVGLPAGVRRSASRSGGRTWGFGIIGVGTIAEFHAQAIGGLQRGLLAGVAGRDAAKARAFAEKAGADCLAAGDYRELLASPEVDIVCVTTPSGSHYSIGADVLRAGKHLLLEKPMTMTAEEADRLIELAAANGVALAVVSQRRFEPPYRLAKRMLDEGRLGRLLFVEAQTPFYRSQAYYDSAEWRGTVAHDGGVLMNQAIHQIDLMLWFAGRVRSVCGKVATQTHRMEAEDIGAAVATFESGAVGVVTGSTSIRPGFPPAVKLYGERGAIWIEGNAITHWSVPGTAAPDSAEQASPEGASDPRAISPVNHRTQMEDLIEAIETGRPPLVDGREGREAVRLIRAVYESSRSGREIVL